VMIARKRGPRKAQPRDGDGVMLAPMPHDVVTAAG
jgi:hypothetical protein